MSAITADVLRAPYGVELELVRRGEGPVVVVLHDGWEVRADGPFVDRLAERHHVLIPSHPGFGRSTAPDHLSSVEDLAYFYLELFEQIGLQDYALVGCSFGGWIAAEIAVRRPEALRNLVLVDAVGIRVGGVADRDIADVWAISRPQLGGLLFHDPAVAAEQMDYSQRSDEDLELVARNREAQARYGWSPYLCNPRLARRLHRVEVPTLIVWGAHDGIVGPDYGRAYADAIPDSEMAVLDDAAHLPHVECPDELARRIDAFLEGGRS
jgi:pimeloyl-ACP methyl ester carboxylesterase